MSEKYEINPKVLEYAKKTTRPEDVEHMKKLLEEAIEYWIENYSSMRFYKEEDYKISDIMLFGNKKDKALLFVTGTIARNKSGEVKLIAAHLKEDDTWHFQYAGLPNIRYKYHEDLRKGKEFTEQELMAKTIDKLVEDGLITFYGEISQDYINEKWF